VTPLDEKGVEPLGGREPMCNVCVLISITLSRSLREGEEEGEGGAKRTRGSGRDREGGRAERICNVCAAMLITGTLRARESGIETTEGCKGTDDTRATICKEGLGEREREDTRTIFLMDKHSR